MLTETTLNAVKQSYGRCSMRATFWDEFYHHFLQSSPEVAEKFKNTDLAKQKSIIKNSLNFVIMHAQDPSQAFAKNKLEEIGKVHDHAHHDIRPELYGLWIESLIATIKAAEGAQFTPELEKSWRGVLDPAIKLLKSKY